jgi:hypothetical protein
MPLTQVNLGLIDVPQSYGFRNRIINGDMRIDQRNNGAAVTNSTGSIYTLDRWLSVTNGSSCTVQRVTGSTGNNFAARITGASSNAVTQFSQRIEALNISDLAGQSVTVSFTLSGSTAGSASVRFIYPTATDNYNSVTEPVAGTVVNFTTTPTRYTATRTLDANANKGLWILLDRGATGAGVTWTIEDVQLEAGSTATPFERVDYSTSLIRCQRYFESNRDAVSQDYLVGLSTTSGRKSKSTKFSVTKRGTPTVTSFDQLITSGVMTTSDTAGNPTNNVAPTGIIANIDGFLIYRDSSTAAGISYGWTASAEL